MCQTLSWSTKLAILFAFELEAQLLTETTMINLEKKMFSQDFSKVPYLSFFDFGPNKGLFPLFQNPLFGVSSVT